MQVTLRELFSDEEIEAVIREAVEELLSKTVSFSFIPEGVTTADDTPVVATAPAKKHVCPECGKDHFSSAAALAGHRYWKHDVARDSKKTPAQLKKESSKRTAARHAADAKKPTKKK